jgi:hypothetical protein
MQKAYYCKALEDYFKENPPPPETEEQRKKRKFMQMLRAFEGETCEVSNWAEENMREED